MNTIAKAKRRFKKIFGLKHKLNSDFAQSQSALIVHGLHKSASMFLYKFFAHLCEELKAPLHSIHNTPPNDKTFLVDTKESLIFCPERSFQTAPFQFDFLQTKHLFQVRDPRDILVSEYFSIGWSHTDQNWDEAEKARRQKIQQMTIDQYVVQEPQIGKYPLVKRYQPLLKQIGSDNICVVKYETMVHDFPKWLATVLPLVGLGSSADISFLTSHYIDEFQADKSDGSHKRNVASGDHKKKLAPQTIEILNERFAPVLQALGYEASIRA